jgi:hypothetical protein
MTRRLFLLAAIATALLAEDYSGLVVGISDGDTIRVLHDGREERVRLWASTHRKCVTTVLASEIATLSSNGHASWRHTVPRYERA